MPKKQKPVKLDELTPEEKMKYEVAEELGLLDDVLKNGWKTLSARDTGRIGGILSRRNRKKQKKEE